MIQAAGVTRGDHPLLIVGLSAHNFRLLLDDRPIHMRTGRLGLPAMSVVIMGGETSQDIHAKLAGVGVTAPVPDYQARSGEEDQSYIVQGTGTYGGDPLLLLGLPRAQCDALTGNRRIELEADLLGLPPMRIIVIGGETEYTIRDHLIDSGLIDSDTVQRDGVPGEDDEKVPLVP